MKFSETPEFSKDLKRLSKKYRSLPDDLHEFKKVVAAVPCGSSKHFVTLHREEDLSVIKARLFCKYLKGSSLRVVYAHDAQQDQIAFIELYYKGDQERESSERISEFLAVSCHCAKSADALVAEGNDAAISLFPLP
jgi:hypothetical protein